jgi:hypothetical protein
MRYKARHSDKYSYTHGLPSREGVSRFEYTHLNFVIPVALVSSSQHP